MTVALILSSESATTNSWLSRSILQIKKLIHALGNNVDDVEREALTAMRSAPFDPPERRRIAVKIVTATGMEMTAMRHVEDSHGQQAKLPLPSPSVA